MGRKTRRPVQTRRRPSLPKIFQCPRCEAQAVKIQIDTVATMATIDCGSCHLNVVIENVKSMSEPIDIFGDFIDRYYESLEGMEEFPPTEPMATPTVEISNEDLATESPDSDPTISKTGEVEDPDPTISKTGEVEEPEPEVTVIEKEQPPTQGFVPLSKADVLKAKAKQNPVQK